MHPRSARFERVLVVGNPEHVRSTFGPLARSWCAIAKADELARSAVPLDQTLALSFPRVFNIDEYLDHTDAILTWVTELVREFGPIDRVVAPTEYAIEIGGLIRAHFGIPGWTPEQTGRVRNKGVMKARMASHGVPTSLHADLGQVGLGALRDWMKGRSNRLVLKPKSQAGSRGVEIHATHESVFDRVSQMAETVRGGHLVEEFVDWPIIHIDGLVRGGELSFLCASRYLHPCIDWLVEQRAMGSVLLTNDEVLRRVTEFATSVHRALAVPDVVFHLEAFFDGTRLQFLEIAGRPGGAAIVPHIRSQFGIDLQDEMVRIDLGLPKGSLARGCLDPVPVPAASGWIATPMPSAGPFRVVGMKGLDQLPRAVFDAELPSLGRRFNEHGDEGLPSGKFHVRAASEDEAEAALTTIANRYQLMVEVIDPMNV